MGLLITQCGKRWTVELREVWECDKSDAEALIKKLLDLKIPFETSAFGNRVRIRFDNKGTTLEEYALAKEAVIEFLDMKKQYGQINGEGND